MIIRAWQGWTLPDKADEYERLLQREIFPGIQSKNLSGLRSIGLLRREGISETEFMTMLRFDRLSDIELLVGGDAEAAYVPESAKLVLHRYEERVRHFESRFDLNVEQSR